MSRLAQAIIVGLIIGMLGIIAGFISVGINFSENPEEKIGLDLLFRLRGVRKPPPDVVVVSIDKESAENLNLPGDPDKWPRSYHTRLIEILSKQGAEVIVFDMIFDQPKDKDHDKYFAKAIRNAGNVVLCQCLESTPEGDSVINPIPSFKQSALALAPFPLPSVPVNLRMYWLFKPEAGNIPTIPVVTFKIFALDVYDEFIQLLKKVTPARQKKVFPDRDTIIRDRSIKEDIMTLRAYFINNPLIGEKMIEEIQNSDNLSTEKKRILKSLIEIYQGPKDHYLNLYGPPGTIKTISYYQILNSEAESAAKTMKFNLKGKAVFVGISDNLRPEQNKEGFHTVFSGSHGIEISGVEIAASAFANLIEDKPVRPVAGQVYFATIFLWGVLIGILCFFTTPAVSAVSILSASALYLGFAVFQFDKSGTWYPITIPLFFQGPVAYFGILLWKFFAMNRERQNIRNAFKYYLPEPIVDQLARDMENVKTDAQIVYGTCLFTDGEQYTSLSENMNPKELNIFMNSYYESVFEPVRRFGGIVSDVIGDSMLSIWATAQPDTTVRKKACAAALDISNAVEKFKYNANTAHLPTRIGLHSGYISIGNVGAIDHYEYRPVGDIVNTASRIENLNKFLGTQILISKQVLQQIDDFLARKVGEFLFRGKTRSVVIYELISHKEKSSEQQRDLCAIFTEGLTAYYLQSWENAIDAFSSYIKIYEQDGPSNYYLAICKNYKVAPPDDNWTGIIRLDN